MSSTLPQTAPLSRRDFLQGTTLAVAAGSLAQIVPASALAREGSTTPGETITLGVIGIGPRCIYDLTAMLKMNDVRCVAIADVQENRRLAGKKLVDDAYGTQDCVLYSDFRQLLDRKDIDAVLVATGDRWHARASILSAEAGKDVYSEKPCGITIGACQELADTMHRLKRVFQAGTQRRSVPNFQKAVELVQTGKIGKLQEMHASVYIPTLKNSWLPAERTPSSDKVDWNLWLGPAAWRPFNQQYVNGAWRGEWDFDSGARLLDWGAHTVDLCQWANQADNTTPIEYVPEENRIVCKYANGVILSIDFLKEPFKDRSPQFITRLGTCPVRFVGDQGSIETGDEGEIVFSPETLGKDQGDPTKRVRGLDVSAHARNFVDCIRSRELTIANQDVMRRSHITCHAAAAAWVLQRPLKFDPVKEEFVNDVEANGLRHRPERDWA